MFAAIGAARRARRRDIGVNLVLWGDLVGNRPDEWLDVPWPVVLGVLFNAWDGYARHPITENEIRPEMRNLTAHE